MTRSHVSDLASQIVQGSLDDFRGKPTGTLLGKEMADRLQLAVGDSFILEAVGESRRYRVSPSTKPASRTSTGCAFT